MNPEAARALNICNVCRYCSDLCPVFEAGPLRPGMTEHDVAYLASLCHNCQACWYSCQSAPPHELAVNLPAALSEAREATREHYSQSGRVPMREGLWVWGVTLLLGLHLGAVLAFFLVLPQGKSGHAVFRLLALVRFHKDRR